MEIRFAEQENVPSQQKQTNIAEMKTWGPSDLFALYTHGSFEHYGFVHTHGSSEHYGFPATKAEKGLGVARAVNPDVCVYSQMQSFIVSY